MNTVSEVVIITHAGRSIGGGHASRCSALAEGFASLGVAVRWLVNASAGEIVLRRGAPETSVTVMEKPFGEGADAVLAALSASRASLCIVDGYDASPSFLAELRRFAPVVLVDDCRVRPVERECDAVLNYNVNADALGYGAGHAELLLGPEFALLRSEFWTLAPGKGDAVLIIPGASDLLRTGERFVEWWGSGWPRAELVLGPLVEYSMAERLAEAVGALPNLSAVRNPPDLPARMARSRAVLCTSSVTSYEALALRKPLVVFQTAENQMGIGCEIERRGLGVNLGAWGTWGGEQLRRSLENLPPEPVACVNPRGACAAAEALCALSGD
jgi:spore coat polysaccharide biosynthesis predicted glycosyltransferase SpsG